jgi:hypothetical protein
VQRQAGWLREAPELAEGRDLDGMDETRERPSDYPSWTCRACCDPPPPPTLNPSSNIRVFPSGRLGSAFPLRCNRCMTLGYGTARVHKTFVQVWAEARTFGDERGDKICASVVKLQTGSGPNSADEGDGV